MPIPEIYPVYGTITQGGVPQSGMTVTIENLTAGGSDVRITDADGHYLYDDLNQLPNNYSPGDTIQVSVTGKSNTFIAASEPEEKLMDLELLAGCWFLLSARNALQSIRGVNG
jgi:hypothetical protein